MNEPAATWLRDRTPAVLASNNFEEFCDSQGVLGERYKNYVWLRKTYATVKNFPNNYLAKDLTHPEVRSLGELFSELKWVGTPVSQASRDWETMHRMGWRYISSLYVTLPYPRLVGKKSYSLWGTPQPGVMDAIQEATLTEGLQGCGFELIQRTDKKGESDLLLIHGTQYNSSIWVAYFPDPALGVLKEIPGIPEETK